MPKFHEAKLNAEGKKFALVVSRFNDFITEKLLSGALDALIRSGAVDQDIEVVRVPGAFEIPLVAKKMAKTNRFHAVIGLGAVIRGSTPHFDYVSAEVSKGIATVSMETEIPVIFGVITPIPSSRRSNVPAPRPATKDGVRLWMPWRWQTCLKSLIRHDHGYSSPGAGARHAGALLHGYSESCIIADA